LTAGMSRKRGALIAAILGSAVVAVDATVVNIALPRITDDLGGGLAGQQWVANAYLLTLSALILISGSLSDIFGERRVFVAGVAGFGVFSLVCALAPTIGILIVARALQGVAGALLTPASLAIIVNVFPQSERGAAIGSWTAWGGVGYLLGPLLGGQIVDALSWRWVFALNVPLVLATLAIAARYVPSGGRPRAVGARPPVDVAGATLAAVGLGGLSFALIEQPVLGSSSPGVWAPLVAGVAALAAFLVVEARSAHPMLPLSLFRRRNFSVANAETLAMYGGMAITAFFLTIFLQQVAGWSAFEAGATSLVPTTMMFLFSRRFGALADRHGPRWFMTVGPLLVAAGFLLLLRLDAHTSFVPDVLPAMLVYAFGLAMTVAPLTATVLADADASDAGIASAVNNAVARTAGLLATAAVGALLAATWQAKLDDIVARQQLTGPAAASVLAAQDRALTRIAPGGVPPAQRPRVEAAVAQAGVDTFRVAALTGAAMLALAGVLGGTLLRNPRRQPECEHCPGGALVGASEELAGASEEVAA
jgi:EmrB/QacA subfamily drug resistance transporter